MLVEVEKHQKRMSEKYVGWAQGWGVTLAYSVTQSQELSERSVAEAIVALIAKEMETPKNKSNLSLPASVHAVKFAKAIWDHTQKQAFQGFSTEPFFKMPPVTRALVVLKTKAQLLRHQLAEIFSLSINQVDRELENAKLQFSRGKPWIENTQSAHVEFGLEPHTLFAQYLGKDLNLDLENKLHLHLLNCKDCRAQLIQFKQNYEAWEKSIPQVDMDSKTKKFFQTTALKTFKASRKALPNPLAGARKVLTQVQMQALIFGFLSLLFLHYITSR